MRGWGSPAVPRATAYANRPDRIVYLSNGLGRATPIVERAIFGRAIGRGEQPVSLPAVLIEAAVQYLPFATPLVLNFRPAKWILYVLTGAERVPSDVLIW